MVGRVISSFDREREEREKTRVAPKARGLQRAFFPFLWVSLSRAPPPRGAWHHAPAGKGGC